MFVHDLMLRARWSTSSCDPPPHLMNPPNIAHSLCGSRLSLSLPLVTHKPTCTVPPISHSARIRSCARGVPQNRLRAAELGPFGVRGQARR